MSSDISEIFALKGDTLKSLAFGPTGEWLCGALFLGWSGGGLPLPRPSPEPGAHLTLLNQT